jgi:ATP-dependent Zn protease
VPLDRLDPALTRPGRMGRHVQFRTPTKEDRKDVFDLYLAKVAHDSDLDEPKRRDEIARITNGYSPAMIDQVCSMALTNAQHEGKVSFGWDELVQAMTTIESGTAVNVIYPEHELRAVAIHEAGHAVAGHVYRPQLESSRLSTRMRGGALGHHQMFEREERFSRWQHEEIGTLVHVLGAMAAEHVFYEENSGGVGGDLQTATDTAAWMVGTAGMRPLRIELNGNVPEGEDPDEVRERIMKRLEGIGRTLMNRTRGSADFHADPIAAILGDQHKQAVAAQILGQAYLIALNLVIRNKAAVDAVATRLAEKRELYGDELVELLDAQQLVKPELDYTKEETWPKM